MRSMSLSAITYVSAAMFAAVGLSSTAAKADNYLFELTQRDIQGAKTYSTTCSAFPCGLILPTKYGDGTMHDIIVNITYQELSRNIDMEFKSKNPTPVSDVYNKISIRDQQGPFPQQRRISTILGSFFTIKGSRQKSDIATFNIKTTVTKTR